MTYKKACRFYEEVLDRNPKNLIAANNLAFYMAEYEPSPENLSRAESLMRPWVEKFPKQPELVDTLAWIKYRQGKYDRARELLEGLGDKVKKYPVISYHLGMVYYRLGEKERALEYLKEALKGQKGFPGRKEAERVVQSLEKV